MRNILIFGNSGSGKSTLAKQLCKEHDLAHLDLDTQAWLPTTPPERKPLSESQLSIEQFMRSCDGWVIEGYYTDLLEIAATQANEAIFMNLSVASCIENARNRPWEPHKYASKVEQDDNLDMLVDWIAQYPTRQDTFSESAHKALYQNFAGKKHNYTHND